MKKNQLLFHVVFFCGLLVISSLSLIASRSYLALKKHPKREVKDFELLSPAFADKWDMPSVYTCDGADVSPPLRWSQPPKGTKSFVLICKDPDAMGRTWIHWIIFNLPARVKNLTVGADIAALGGTEALNTFGRVSYGGPCPTIGKHRYVFRLYALDKTKLDLNPESSLEEIKDTMREHVLGKATLTGYYQLIKNRKRKP